MEIIPGIHQLKLPLQDNPLGYVNTYLVHGTNGWLLIDTGWYDDASFNAITDHLGQLGIEFKEINRIICTHVHPDHFGLAGRLKEACGAQLAIGEVEKAFIDSADKFIPTMFENMNRWMIANGVPDDHLTQFNEASDEVLKLVVPAAPEVGLKDGDLIDTGPFILQVIFTPGHSGGHICLYESSHRILFSGDHILPVTTPNISIHSETIGDPLGDYLASLEKIRHLQARLVLPAHEDVFTDLAGRINELIAHHETRKGEILTALDSSAKTAFEISAEITWMEGEILWDEMQPIDRRLAVAEALAHLESLRCEGRITRYTHDTCYYYSSA